MRSRKLWSVLVFGAALAPGWAGASALALPPASVTATINSTKIDFSKMGSSLTDLQGVTTFTGSCSKPACMSWDFRWNFSAKADPYIDGNLMFTNTTSGTQTFDVTLAMPVSPGFSPGYESGKLSWTWTDNNDTTATLSSFAWYGQIDGADAFSLATFGGTCGGSSIGCSGTGGPLSGGPTLVPTGVSTSIGMRFHFDLSAGDSASFTSRFEVTPVPLPAPLVLFASGLLGLTGLAARRRRA